MGESFDAALQSGKTFIQWDNLRGKTDCQKLETFMTDSPYMTRCAYSKNAEIDPTRKFITMTTNSAEMTEDLANRMLPIRIRKRKKGYQYKAWPEGNVLQHIKDNQPKYLGAVMTLVMTCYERGCPFDEEARTSHDFRDFAGIAEKITKDILREPSMFDGYEAVRKRMYSPELNWIREVGLTIVDSVKAGTVMSAKAILELLEDEGRHDLQPGLKDHESVIDSDACMSKALRLFGRKMGRIFKEVSEVAIEDVIVKKTNERQKRYDGGGYRDVPSYKFLPTNA